MNYFRICPRLIYFIYKLIWTLSISETFVSNTKIYPRANECTFSWHNEHPDVPQLECTIWQVKLNIISHCMFCMNGNAIDLLLKVELYPIKLDGKLTLSLNQNTNTTCSRLILNIFLSECCLYIYISRIAWSMHQLLQNYQF